MKIGIILHSKFICRYCNSLSINNLTSIIDHLLALIVKLPQDNRDKFT